MGSIRLLTDVIARHDDLAFGEEILDGQGRRTNEFRVSDIIDQRFIGEERDDESSLEYCGVKNDSSRKLKTVYGSAYPGISQES